jgi:hypothetical protein
MQHRQYIELSELPQSFCCSLSDLFCFIPLNTDLQRLLQTSKFRCLEWSLLIPAGAIVDVSSCYQISPDSTDQCHAGGRHSKKRQHYSIDNLRPGRAPVGLPNSMNTTHLETESEESDQEPPPQLNVSSIQARLHRLLNSTKIQVNTEFECPQRLLTQCPPSSSRNLNLRSSRFSLKICLVLGHKPGQQNTLQRPQLGQGRSVEKQKTRNYHQKQLRFH